MKAKDLKSHFTFEERHPYLEDRVFYVPRYYPAHDHYTLPPFLELFGNEGPVYIEYCSGNGDWVTEKACQDPGMNWIAVEKRFDRVRKIWAKVKNRHLNNVLVVCGEAWTFTRYYLPPSVIESVFINFPDPWPKGRHAKHRLLQDRFLDELARILKRGKCVTFVSDDVTYIKSTLALFCRHTHFDPIFPPPFYMTELENYGKSWFENLWRQKGKDIHYTQFVRYADSN